MTTTHALRTRELRATFALSLPIILGNLAQAVIHATDLVLLGALGSDELAAGALGVNLYQAFVIFGMGLVTAASPLIAAERGRRPHAVRDVRLIVRKAFWAAGTICVPMWIVLWQAEPILLLIGQEPPLAREAGRFVRATQWGLLPFLLFLVLRNYVAALERPVWSMAVVGVAIGFNALAGWALINGRLGLPALGLVGAGIGSALSCLLMFALMATVVIRHRHFQRYRLFGGLWVADWPRFRAIWRMGLPIAVTLALEVTVFNAAVFLMGLIDRVSLAAHAIAIQIAALAFMVPLGIAQAATVRVGLASGAGDRGGVARAGWTAIVAGVLFALAMAALLVAAPRALIAGFIDAEAPGNAAVVAHATAFLMVAAAFQVADGAQAIGAGVLRGLGDTRVPMLFAAVGYWVIGIGSGVLLAFPLGLKGLGIWLGLLIGLTAVSVMMIGRWMLRDRLGLVPQVLPRAA